MGRGEVEPRAREAKIRVACESETQPRCGAIHRGNDRFADAEVVREVGVEGVMGAEAWLSKRIRCTGVVPALLHVTT